MSQYLSNGNDGYCLAYGTESSHESLDCIGDFDASPGIGWDVCGTSSATKDRTLVRKPHVQMGNPDWSASSSVSGCEWELLDKDDFSNVGSHVATLAVSPPPAAAGGIVTIREIQYTTTEAGECYDSPLKGRVVTVTGIVTGLDGDSFFMQDCERTNSVDYCGGASRPPCPPSPRPWPPAARSPPSRSPLAHDPVVAVAGVLRVGCASATRHVSRVSRAAVVDALLLRRRSPRVHDA